MTEEGPNKAAQSEATASNINRPWLIRIVIITACLLGYAAWSLNDAFVSYPKRGADYASYAEWQYLGNVIAADRSESPGILRREAAVTDPAAELERLRSDEVHQRNEADLQGGNRQKRAEMEIAREYWLKSLSLIGHLDPAYTNFFRNPDPEAAEQLLSGEGVNAETQSGLRARLNPATPRDRYNELNTRWATESPPGPLRSYDIPVNKIQAALCIGFAAYLGFLFIRVATRTYRWDPAAKALTLPGGQRIEPSELDDVDKRKWDKFIVFLRIKDTHDTLGGKEVKFDTYRHGRIEEWILEMEKAAFPERVKEAEEAEAAKAKAEAEDQEESKPESGPSEEAAQAG
jgi:hypothetical protein